MPWYIKTEDGEKGPVGSKDLLRLARSGQLQEDDLVRRTDKPKWSHARKVKGLFHGPLPIPASSIPTIAETEADIPPSNRKQASSPNNVVEINPNDHSLMAAPAQNEFDEPIAEVIPDDEPETFGDGFVQEVETYEEDVELSGVFQPEDMQVAAAEPEAEAEPEPENHFDDPEHDIVPDEAPAFTEPEFIENESDTAEDSNPLAALAGAAGTEEDGLGGFQEGYAEEIYGDPDEYAEDSSQQSADEEEFEAQYEEAHDIEEVAAAEGFEQGIDDEFEGFDDPRGAISGFSMDDEEDAAVISDDDDGNYDHEAWDELERAPIPDAEKTRRSTGVKRRKKKGSKDRRGIAQVMLWINGILCILIPIVLIIALLMVEPAEDANMPLIWLGVAALSLFAFFIGYVHIYAAKGVGKGNERAYNLATVFMCLSLPGPAILIGLLGLWSLHAKGSKEAAELAAEAEAEKQEQKQRKPSKKKSKKKASKRRAR